MKNFKSHLSAILVLLAAPALLISCREDAPEINYTVNVSMATDFSSVLNALNEGTLRQAEALEKLADAIDRMSGDQADKLQAITDALASAQNTLETKLALIEAAIQAQTLSLAEKLSLVEAAVNALPDYSGKFDAIVSALASLEAQMEALGTSQEGIATQMAAAVTAINGLIEEVNAGHTSAEAAWAEIIAQLEALKEAAGGGKTFTNTVTIDGVTRPILSATIFLGYFEEDYYRISFYLSEDKYEVARVSGYKERHFGKYIDLTQSEPLYTDIYNWSVILRYPNANVYADGNEAREVLKTGMLYMKQTGPGPEFEITLLNGWATDGYGSYDGLDHKFSIDYKGVPLFDDVF